MLNTRLLTNGPDNRVIHKVMKTQNPAFGHKQGEIQKTHAKKYISIRGRGETQKTINFCDKESFTLSFF